jgi:uncharacterized protein (TIGR02246 family)
MSAAVEEFAARYTAAWCSGDPAAVAACYTPDGSLTINGDEPSRGRAAIAAAARGFMEAFPDLTVRIDGLSFVRGRPRYHWTLTGTSAANGRSVRISGYEEWILHGDGLIAASEGSFDEAEFRRQTA